MDARTQMPGLALPFAVVGAAAGWLSVDFLDNPLLGFTPSHAEALAAACTAAIAAGVGRWLSRRCAPGEAWEEPGLMWIHVSGAVIGGGLMAGLVIGALAFGNLDGTSSGIAAGLAAGIVFLPVCALVVAAARRAARARLGSLVADADRRELWGIMAAALAVTTCASLPDWLVGRGGAAPGMIAGTALGAMAALLAFDAGALRKLGVAAGAAATMELRREAEEEDAAGQAPRLDFGLGDEVRARVARGAAYRARERTEAVVLGSPDQAVRAMRWAILKKTFAFLVVSGAVAVHWLAPGVASSVAAHEAVCDMGVPSECKAAAVLLDDEGEIGARPRVWALGTRACFHRTRPDAEACRLLARVRSRSGPLASDETPIEDYYDRGCSYGDGASCALLEILDRSRGIVRYRGYSR